LCLINLFCFFLIHVLLKLIDLYKSIIFNPSTYVYIYIYIYIGTYVNIYMYTQQFAKILSPPGHIHIWKHLWCACEVWNVAWHARFTPTRQFHAFVTRKTMLAKNCIWKEVETQIQIYTNEYSAWFKFLQILVYTYIHIYNLQRIFH